MPHRKDTNFLSEINKFFRSTESAMEILLDTLERFGLTDRKLGIRTKSNSRVSLIEKIYILLLMPFFNIANISKLHSCRLSYFISGQENMFYRLLKSQVIDWRKLYSRFIRLILSKIIVNKDQKVVISNPKQPKCLIIDDTDTPKRGLTSELIGKIWSHVFMKQIIGYKLLVMGYNNGDGFIPIDMSFHGELGKNKDQGLALDKRNKRHVTEIDESGTFVSRKEEYFESKIKVAIAMIKRNIKNIIGGVDYILFDSWFFCEEILSLVKSKKINCHILGMAKMGKSKYEVNKVSLDAKAMLNKYKKGSSRCRKYKCQYITIDAVYKNHDVRLFFSRRNSRDTWHLLITTNRELSFCEAYEIYAMRWSIEVFFKEAKQYLGLGKNQSTSLVSQIAATTICMMQYSLLALIRIVDDYRTIGGLFNETKENSIDITVYEKIKYILKEVLEKFVAYIGLPNKRLVYNFLHSDIFANNFINLGNCYGFRETTCQT